MLAKFISQVSIQGIESQIGQLTKLVSERPQGSLPSNTETNPREQLHAITQDRAKVSGYKPRIPYPTALKRDHTNEQYAFSHMPKYVKFLKELLTNKRKLDDSSIMELNAICSATLQNKLPIKLKDPVSFTILCLIGSLNVENALADLGASMNGMPYKMFKQLDLGEPRPTRMIIQLENRTIRYTRGII
ncbi:Aspartic peptidase [Gossypium australe]|uniref:Aspartic peptidase n=1 Tax=Gossypium australe TaxID=47621 RepID=A0A5B6VWL1_9ROSI|nr:Aspartic peptidase [Gossypium australe]